MLMMLPRPLRNITFAASRQPMKTADRLTLRTRSKSPSDSLSAGPSSAVPAFVDHDVQASKELQGSIEKPTRGGLVRDVRGNWLGVILSQLSSEGRRPVGAPTRQDDFGARSRSTRTKCSPRPDEAPVTTATRPARSKSASRASTPVFLRGAPAYESQLSLRLSTLGCMAASGAPAEGRAWARPRTGASASPRSRAWSRFPCITSSRPG